MSVPERRTTHEVPDEDEYAVLYEADGVISGVTKLCWRINSIEVAEYVDNSQHGIINYFSNPEIKFIGIQNKI